jgi:hypothetical protein
LLPSLRAKGLCADMTSATVFDFSDYVGFNNHAQLLFLGFRIARFHGGLVLYVSYRLDTVTGGTGLICFLYGGIGRYHWGVRVQALDDTKVEDL